MPKPSEVITAVAALMNDSAQDLYTNTACLPYLNLALDELQEIFELNDIPVTHKTSASINIPAGISKLGYDTVPALPADLIELVRVWESPEGLEQWIPMTKKDFIPHYLEDQTIISQFLIYAWKSQAIELIAACADNDIKIDYIGSIFVTPILIGNINVNLPFTKVKTYLEYKTAAICAMFIAENETRAMALNGEASTALDRSLGISVKGQQSIITRRRPFRSGYKRRGLTV